MDWFWKPIGAPLVVAAIVGLAAFYFGRATAPDAPAIRGELRWVDVQNPLFRSRIGYGADIEKALLPFLKLPGLAFNLERAREEPQLRVMAITFRNDSAIRTK